LLYKMGRKKAAKEQLFPRIVQAVIVSSESESFSTQQKKHGLL
jgi:hypothetical protein